MPSSRARDRPSSARLTAGGAGRAWLAVLFSGLAWSGITYGNVLWFPLMQTEVPPYLLGRASSVDWMLSLALAPAGTIAGGAVAAVAGVRFALILGGSVAAATGAVLLVPRVTEPDRKRQDRSAVAHY